MLVIGPKGNATLYQSKKVFLWDTSFKYSLRVMVQAGALSICTLKAEKMKNFSGVTLLVLKQGRPIAYFFPVGNPVCARKFSNFFINFH